MIKYSQLKVWIMATAVLLSTQGLAQNNNTGKPKLVVGLVVDQMRWDFLYKYQNRYGSGGFKRLLNQGFSCDNTFIPYAPTVTAAGHACIYTGSVPAINGIPGNAWYSHAIGRQIYCVEDTTVSSVGTENANGKMSPRNLLTTTITDQLKISNEHKSRTVGICIKDRGSILPAGHTADAVYWYDNKTGNFITSTYYTNDLPQWVKDFNQKKWADTYYKQNWNTLYPINTYTLSTTDEKPYEGKLKGANNTSFPHKLEQYVGKDYDVLPGTPYGNNITFEMTRAAIQNMQLGKGAYTDFLAISLSSPDYIGHRFGPNSIEIEDTYLRLDKELESFLKYLDTQIGVGKYTLFLTADHGVAHVPGYMKEHKMPAGLWDNDEMIKELNTYLKNIFKADKLIVGETNYQLYINRKALADGKISRSAVVDSIIAFCDKQNAIAMTFDLHKLGQTALPSPLKEMLTNGYNYKLGGDVQVVLQPAWIDGNGTGTTHGLWNPYDSHIPLIWFGYGIAKGKSYKTHYMTDIAATLAALLKIEVPNGCVGEVITEALK